MTREQAVENAIRVTDHMGYEMVVAKLWHVELGEDEAQWGSYMASEWPDVQQSLARSGVASAVSLRIRSN
jgi:hypothetical protein